MRSVSVLSRIENETTAPSRAVVERYAALTGRSDLIKDYLARDQLVFADQEEADPETFSTIVRLTDLEHTVDVGQVITVMERRTIIAVKPVVRRMRILAHMIEVDGVMPQVLDARAYAVVTGHRWLDEAVHATDVELLQPLKQGDPPITFQIFRQYDRLAPRMTQTASYSIPEFRLTIAFPEPGYSVLHVNGMPSAIAASALRAAAEGRPHPLPMRTLHGLTQVTVVFKDVESRTCRTGSAGCAPPSRKLCRSDPSRNFGRKSPDALTTLRCSF